MLIRSTTIDGSKVMQSNVKAYKLVVPIVGPGLIKAGFPGFVTFCFSFYVVKLYGKVAFEFKDGQP